MFRVKTGILSILIVGIWSFGLTAQEYSTPRLCQPGVCNKSKTKGLSVEYTLRPGKEYTIRSEDPLLAPLRLKTFDHFDFGIKVPLYFKESFKVLAGFSHYRESLQFEHTPEQADFLHETSGERGIRSSTFNLYFLKSISEKFYATSKFSLAYNGDFDGLVDFNGDYAIFKAALMLGIKNNTHKEIGFGLLYRTGIHRNFAVYPFFVLNQTFNDKWGLESVLPVKINLRRNFSPKSIMLMGVEYESAEYALSLDDPSSFSNLDYLKRSGIKASAMWQRQLNNWTWINFEAGYYMYFKPRIKINGVEDDRISVNPSGGPFLSIGVFLSPPS